MRWKERRPVRFSKGLFGRLILSYFVVPFVESVLLLIPSFPHRPSLLEWLGILPLFGVFGFAAMVVLGTPLLFCYLRLGWTGFLPFALGGGICAGITALLPLFFPREPVLLRLCFALYFALPGAVAGAVFRIILFGLRRNAGAPREL